MPRYVVERDFPSGLNIPANEDAGGGMAQEPSLYDRLGGKPAITAVVDDFVGNVAADKRVNGRFANANIPRLKQLLVELICAGTGGPCTYSGRDMRTAHKGMNIGDVEFTAVVEDLVKTLDKFNATLLPTCTCSHRRLTGQWSLPG